MLLWRLSCQAVGRSCSTDSNRSRQPTQFEQKTPKEDGKINTVATETMQCNAMRHTRVARSAKG